MYAGTLDRRVLLESRVETQDETGDAVPTWAYFDEVWCALEPGKGREFVTEDQLHSEVQGRIRIRYLPGVTAKMRGTVNGTRYDIVAVLDIKDQHEEMHLIYSQGVNDGG